MGRSARWVALLAAGVFGLAAAGPAAAAYAPSFSVTSTAGSTSLTFRQSVIDAPTASLVFYAGARYSGNLGASGAAIGRATAAGQAADLGGSTAQLTGPVMAAASTDTVRYADIGAPLAALAQSCTGTETHDAYWVMQLAGAGQRLNVPVYVDRIADTGPLGAAASFSLAMCLPAPDVPYGTTGRSPLGIKLTDLTLTLDGFSATAPGWHLWLLDATPYTPGLGTAATNGEIEVQAFDRTPVLLKLVAKRAGANRVLVSGRLTAGGNGKGLAGKTVQILAGARVIARTLTDRAGRYGALVNLPRGTRALSATASVPVYHAGDDCRPLAVSVCIALTAGGFTATTRPVAITG